LDKKPELLYNQVVRDVNPLTLTEERELRPYGLPLRMKGQSALLYAVLNSHCPQRMVPECIRLGFSTHQPALTLQRRTHNVEWLTEITAKSSSVITSPLLLAVVRGLPVVAHMLYVMINNEAVEQVNTFKYLGTVLDNKASFSSHVDTVCKKANQRLYLLKKLKSFDVDRLILETVY
jgi:hypothetical protein